MNDESLSTLSTKQHFTDHIDRKYLLTYIGTAVRQFSITRQDSRRTNHILSLLSKQFLKINANKFRDCFVLLWDGNASMKNAKKSKNTKSRTSSATKGRSSDYISSPDFLRWEEHVLDCLLESLRPFTRVYIDDKKIAQKSNRVRCSLLHPVFASRIISLSTDTFVILSQPWTDTYLLPGRSASQRKSAFLRSGSLAKWQV